MAACPIDVVSTVVAGNLCSGCGVCAGVCPQDALSMAWNGDGDLTPQLASERCTNCGLCVSVCPFRSGVHDPRALNESTFARSDAPGLTFDTNVGWYLDSIAGYSTQYRPTSSSGGLLTSALASMLDAGEIDAAVVVEQRSGDQGPMFRFREVTTSAGLRECSGSVYCPVSIDEWVHHLLRDGSATRFAVVGVPCLCAALRLSIKRIPRLAHRIAFVMGVACGMYQNRMYMELLMHRLGVEPGRAAGVTVSFRVKTTRGPASNFGFQAYGGSGDGSATLQYHGLPAYLGRTGYFRCNACNYCRDVFAEAADACFMDAWLPEFASDPGGTSLVVIRNPLLRRHVSATEDRAISPIPVARVLESQRGHVRRKQRLIDMRMGRPNGPLLERAKWRVERATQARSKALWARYGQSRTLLIFWARMIDLRLARWVLDVADRASRRVSRLTGRLRSVVNRP